MTRDEYITSAMRSLDVQSPAGYEEKMVRSEAGSLFDQGWEWRDAVRYLRCMEEVSPDLAEDIALARMSLIRKKYEKTS